MHARFSGQALRERRLERSLSVEQVAVAIERSAQTVGLYERERVVPRTPMICQLAAVLDCQVGDLFESERTREVA